MKSILYLGRKGCFLFLLIWSPSFLKAQITAVSNDIFLVSPGDTLYVNGLGFYPDSIFNLTGISILESNTLLNGSTKPHINKVFSFSPTTPSFSGVLGFRYNESDLNGIPESELQLNFFNTTWTRASSDSLNTNSNYLVSSPINSLPKELTLASTLNALPLVWLNIQAQRQEKGIVIQWTTSQEDQVQSFRILHSIDGKNWIVIGSVKPQGHLFNQYSFTHVQPSHEKNYYRIQELVLDGRNSLSKIVYLFAPNGAPTMELYPNPSNQGKASIRLTNPSTIRIYQNNGILLFSKTYAAGVHSLNERVWKAGTYLITDGKQTIPWVVQ